MSAAEHIIQVIAGPTASGKSGLAARRAAAEGGVVINADALQVYDALPLLTAQPDSDARALVPHRLYGFLPATEFCTAAVWAQAARHEIGQAFAQGLMPFVTGGTGLYLKALMEGLSPIPEVPAEVRARGTALQAELGNPGFHRMLAGIDPVMAARLDPQNTQRLIRAWEVLEATGRSLSYWQSLPPASPPEGWRFIVSILQPTREDLYRKCDARFVEMMDRGVLNEIAALEEEIRIGRLPADCPATQALGYHALRDHTRGLLTREEAVTLAQQQTRHYARRQVTWFRHQVKPGGAIKGVDSVTF